MASDFTLKLYNVLQLCQWHLVLASDCAVTSCHRGFLRQTKYLRRQLSYTRIVEPRADPPIGHLVRPPPTELLSQGNSLGLPLGLEAPVKTPNEVIFLFFQPLSQEAAPCCAL